MIEKKPSAKKVFKANLLCKAKLSNEKPCPKKAETGKNFCRWHDPEDETWREVYARLEKSTPEGKTDIVLGLIEEHPENKLVLPKRDGQRADLSHIDLSQGTLRRRRIDFGVEEPPWWDTDANGVNLWGADLQGAYLWHANLRGAVLESANLQDADLRYIFLQGAILENVNLQDASLNDAVLHSANLWKANLQNALLPRAVLENAFIQGANLQNTAMENAKLQYASLNGSNLQAANLNEAKLQGAQLAGAVLVQITLNDANLQKTNLEAANLQRAYLYKANLRDANLKGADLQDAHFDGANLLGADLTRANLQGAHLNNANLEGADLRNAKLKDVDMSAVQSISHIYVSGAWLDRIRIRREQLGDAIGEEQNHDYANAKRGYLALKQNFNDIGDYDAASWAYRKERRMEKLEAKESGREALKKFATDPLGNIVPRKRNWGKAAASCFKFCADTFVERLCDYGESVWRVIGWMAALLFIIGPLLFAALGGINWNDEPDLTHEYYTLAGLPRFMVWYRTYLLYTLDTMTTANFSGLKPINDAVKLASGFFAIAGIVLAGLLGFVAGNRIRRS